MGKWTRWRCMRTWDFQPAVLLGFQPGWIELDIPGSSSICPKGRCNQYHYYYYHYHYYKNYHRNPLHGHHTLKNTQDVFPNFWSLHLLFILREQHGVIIGNLETDSISEMSIVATLVDTENFWSHELEGLSPHKVVTLHGNMCRWGRGWWCPHRWLSNQ